MMEQCIVCRSDSSLKSCAGCVQVSYCSQQCQKKHWKQHKPLCRPFKLTPIAGKGLGLVASRLIKKGEVIIKENPVLVKGKGSKSLLDQYNGHNEKVKAEILCLHHDNPGEKLEKRLGQIFLSNACDVQHGGSVALYLTIPRMNHSCMANVVWSHTRDCPLTKEVRTLRQVAPGEELCPNYIDSFDNTFSSCADRKALLSKRWKFDCQCHVCHLPSKEQAENDARRLELRSLHQSIPSLMSEWKVDQALAAAVSKLELMMTMEEEMMTVF